MYNRNRQKKRLPQYDEMLAAQSGTCAICRQEEKSGRYKSLCIDHCHDSGAIRGLLCSNCNRALGLFKDSPQVMAAATAYLERSK